MKKIFPVVALFFLASCTGLTGVRDVSGLACPHTGFLKDHDRSAFVLGDDAYKTALTQLNGTCYFPDEKTVAVSSRFYVVAKSGQAVTGDTKVSVPYIVTVLDENENVLTYSELSAEIELEDGFGFTQEELSQKIPVPALKAAARYKVIYGFPKE